MNYQQPPHPLQQKELRLIKSWSEWKNLWDAEVHPERLIGLLHVGFDTPFDRDDTFADKIVFHLCVADGHAATIGTWEEGRKSISWTAMGQHTNWTKIRQKIAQKAFAMLCQRFFQGEKDKYTDRMSWFNALTDDSCVLLDHVLAFFLPKNLPKDRFAPEICNLPKKEQRPEYAITVSFLTELCACGWGCSFLADYGDDAKIEENIQHRRPQFIRILAGLGRFDLIQRLTLDDACCRALKEIALGRELNLPTEPNWTDEYRLPKTLEEAAAGGSQAAQLLILHRIKVQEKSRSNELRELARQRQEAEAKMQKLTKPNR